MDPFRLCLALGPLAAYLLLVGLINLSRRPFVVSGARDAAALGVGVSGLVFVGPIELLLPQQAINNFAPHIWVVWLLLVGLYALSITLAVLVSRPRLTIYNITVDALRPVLAEVIDSLDPQGRWAGNSLSLPTLKVDLHVESTPAMHNVTLVAADDDQSYAGWRQLELALVARIRSTERSPNVWGAAMASAAVVMIGTMAWQLIVHPQAVTQGFLDMLRL